jgi:Protein kinase domain
MVYTGIFTYKDRHGNRKQLTGVKPDAAVKFSEQHLVLAMLELKKAGHNQNDMQKCVLMTSISALALVREGVVNSVTIPFVVNVGMIASLYTTTVEHDTACPAITIVFQANMSDQSNTAQIVAYLAVILHKLKQDVSASARALDVRRVLDAFCASSARSDSHQQASSNRTEPMGGASDQSAMDRSDDDREAQDVAAAEEVAACEGEVDALRDSGVRLLRSDGGRRGFPLYFWGVIPSTKLPVFIKVWREGGGERARRRRRNVETEIRLLKRAHQSGTPCPEVVDRLTKVNFRSERGRYHRLVMHRLANETVRRDDCLPFAISLIKAVLKLHQAGVLHCDIKPNNILWNSSTKTVSLVDFGHAQEERNAESYNGTVGFTAPEVTREGKPHSRLTDAYSVGRTLLYVCECVLTSHEHSPVRDAAAQLSSEDALTRITLEDALRQVLPVEKQARSLEVPQTSLEIVTP